MSEIANIKRSSGQTRLFMGKYVGAAIAGVNVLAWVLIVVLGTLVPSSAEWLYIVAGALVLVEIGLLMLVPGIRAMALQTFAQCLRMKLALAFIVLFVLIMLIITSNITGDGTLSGQAKTFISYSVSAVGIVLSLLTVLLSAAVISEDVRNKQVYTVATKPVARWQYVVGRWLGVVLLAGAMLLPASAVIYGVSQYIRTRNIIDHQPIQDVDRLALETEVFAARNQVPPESIDVKIDEIIRARFGQLKSDPHAFQSALDSYKLQTNGDEEAALRKIVDEYRKQAMTPEEQAAPLGLSNLNSQNIGMLLQAISAFETENKVVFPACLNWRFKGIQTSGAQRSFEGAVKRRMDHPDTMTTDLQVSASTEALGLLMYQGPVRLNKLDARVMKIVEDPEGKDHYFWANVVNLEQNKLELAEMKKDAVVSITIEPAIQVSYKGTVTNPGDYAMPVRGVWKAENPTTGGIYAQWAEGPSGSAGTVTIPAKMVDQNGEMKLSFINCTASTVNMPRKDISVLYRVGGFEMNLLRASLLVLLQMMFLAGLGVLAGSFLSFQVAALMSFAVLPFSLARSFLTEAMGGPGVVQDTWQIIGAKIVWVMNLLLPDMQRTSPSDSLVAGLNLSWAFLGETALLQLAVRTLLLLALASLIFHKRELARVQV